MPLFEAIKADPYSNGGADISVTSLLKPVQAWVLEKRYDKHIEIDAVDRLAATYGTLMALLLERTVKDSLTFGNRFRTEVRNHTYVRGWALSGQYDLYDREERCLSDYKFVGGYKAKQAKEGDVEDWLRQLNILRWLQSKQSKPEIAEKLQIVCLIRDHTAKSEKEGLRPVEVFDIPVQPLESVGIWVEDRVRQFQEALKLPDDQLPDCTEEETWNGRRCQKWCSASKFCIQWNGGASGWKGPISPPE